MDDLALIVFGQYNGYLYEENVKKNSNTDTFFALKTGIISKRWRGVPVYLRAGKQLARWMTEIKLYLKQKRIDFPQTFRK